MKTKKYKSVGGYLPAQPDNSDANAERRISVGRLLQVERITGIDRSKLRRDLFNRERAAGTP